jgi:hypothetical protein
VRLAFGAVTTFFLVAGAAIAGPAPSPPVSFGGNPAFVHEAQVFPRPDTGDPSEPAFDHFGSAIAISGDTLVVGAPDDDLPGGLHEGSAYVFVRSGNGWIEQQKLRASDPAAGALFGASVAIQGDTLVVGAPDPGLSSGAAYVFVRSGSTWVEQQKLAGFGGDFGDSVALWGNSLVVGAWGEFVGGAAYVFVRSGTVWTQQQRLVAFDGSQGDGFGAPRAS